MAAIAALIAFIVGYPAVGWVLLAGIAVHGLGWLFLYRQHGG
jgi:hypothetical protein